MIARTENERLEMMCNGTIDVAPREGGSTVVRMTIPRSSKRVV